MKTLSFHDYRAGHSGAKPLFRLDSPSDGVTFGPGIHLLAAPNGTGKSTLFRTLAGLCDPLSGEARIDGSALVPSLRVHHVSEFLVFPKFLYGVEWVRAAAGDGAVEPGGSRVNETDAWDLLGISVAERGRFIGRLSQGARRKLTWVAADLCRKPILLLDEPLDGLDLRAMEGARALLARWKREERLVWLIAHQAAELLDLCDRVLLLRPGADGAALQDWRDAVGSAHPDLTPSEFRKKTLQHYL